MKRLHITDHDIYVKLLEWYISDIKPIPAPCYCGEEVTSHHGVHPLDDVTQLVLFQDLLCEECFNHPDVQLKILAEVV